VPSAGDFFVYSRPDSVTVQLDSRGFANINLKSTGFTGTVSLKITVSPSLEENGPNVKLTMSTLTLTMNGVNGTLLRFSTDEDTQLGVYTVTVTATAGSISHATKVTFTVVSGEHDFTISGSRGSMIIAQGSSANRTLRLESNDFSGTVQLTVTMTPNFAERPFFRFSVRPVVLTLGGAASTVLTMFADDDTPVGSYSVIVIATSGGITRTFAFTLLVTR
jgi:hypothetical protein